MKIRELLARNPAREIAEVIKVEQEDEEVVYREIQEYVATDAIKDHFRILFNAVAEGPASPHEDVGVWVSGFFGSGKSSFAKLVGYAVGKRVVRSRPASEWFKESVRDNRTAALLDLINARIPTHVVMFDVSMERGQTEGIVDVMYRALLKSLDYATDFDLAALEISLERDDRLKNFEQRVQAAFGEPWSKRRKGPRGINEASRILHEVDATTYPAADSWAKSLAREPISPNLLAERAFDLVTRRRPGHAPMFVVDEVGQFVSQHRDRILELQGVVQAFGVEGRRRVKTLQAPGLCWVIVTSQEKLNEVVDALESKRMDLAKLQDRFSIKIDLKQSDIAEVAGRRVLEKTAAGQKVLEELYTRNEGRLTALCGLERTGRSTAISKGDFVALYPYLPYQIDLSIDIVSGLRLRRGTLRHIGGSNRTIIKQAQQMLIHPRTNLGEAPVGTLVTLDRVYELLYAGNLLPSETSGEIDRVAKNLSKDEVAQKAAKAVALLEVVKDLPRTPRNIAAVLHSDAEHETLQPAVEHALDTLERSHVVRQTEEGYKLLTSEERNWEEQRREREPKPRDRQEIRKQSLREIFGEPQFRTYRFKNLRQFPIALSVNGETVIDGQIPFHILTAEDRADAEEQVRRARTLSNEQKNAIFWVVTLPEEIHRLVTEVHRSTEMITEHERLAAQNRLAPEERALLAEEKGRHDRYRRELRARMLEALQSGTGFFRGVQQDGSALGQRFEDVARALLENTIPQMFPKLELGNRPLKGDEPEKFLTAANLNALPGVFREGEDGLGLVIQQGGKFVPNAGAEICQEVLDYIKQEHAYGIKVTGKMIEAHFQGFGYGWDLDVLRLSLAVLLRAGAIEVTHQGRRYRSANDPVARDPFIKPTAFRSASFAPREELGLKMLTEAARNYEEITGREVDIEETAIAASFQALASEDREQAVPLVARMRALNLPGVEAAEEFLQWIRGILEMPPDDCVKTLAGEGRAYKESRARMSRLVEATRPEGVELLPRARRVLDIECRDLQSRGFNGELANHAARIEEIVGSADFFERQHILKESVEWIEGKFRLLYEEAHNRRSRLYEAAVEEIRQRPEWAALSSGAGPTSDLEAVDAPLRLRACSEVRFDKAGPYCAVCHSSLGEMEADIRAVDALKSTVIEALARMVEPSERIERVKIASFLNGTLTTPEEVDAVVERLRDHLRKLVNTGVRVILE
jgi:hypothetical protein